MAARDPSERALIARIAAHEKWAKCRDPAAATAPARRAMLDRFEREVDPTGSLPPAERSRRAESAKRAYFTRLALKSAQARRRRAQAQVDIERADAELAELASEAEVAAA